MKINSQRPKSHYAISRNPYQLSIQRPKSLPTISRSSSHLSIQRPKSLPTISKRPLTSPKPIKTPLIYSPSKSKESTNSSLHSSAMRSPPPSAKIDVIHPVDLSQYDTLLSPTHTYPLKIVAIYYITLIYTIINSFCINIIDILKRINDTDYIKPRLFKKTAIERLIVLKQNLLREEYKYKLLDGSIINISGIYTLIDFFLFKKTKERDIKIYNNWRSYLYSVKKWKSDRVEREMSKLYRELSIYVRDRYTTDADIEEYMRSYFNKNKVLQHILSNIQGIDISVINNKLKSQFKMIEELINILNDIWVDEKTKGGFIKFILKTQKTSGIQSGGMLNFLRSKRVLPYTEHQQPMNMRAKTGRSQQIIKLYKSMRSRANRVLPEQVLHLNMYRRSHTANFQNIYDYLFLLNSYLFEVDDKMMQKSMKLLTKYYKKLIRDYEKEYKHIYKDPPIQKESIRSPMFLMNSKQYKLKQIPTFTEMKQKNEDLIALKFKKHSDMLALEKLKLEKHIRGQHIKFHLEINIKYIKDKIDSIEKDLAHLFP
jgi:hypothetical protein